MCFFCYNYSMCTVAHVTLKLITKLAVYIQSDLQSLRVQYV